MPYVYSFEVFITVHLKYLVVHLCAIYSTYTIKFGGNARLRMNCKTFYTYESNTTTEVPQRVTISLIALQSSLHVVSKTRVSFLSKRLLVP